MASAKKRNTAGKQIEPSYLESWKAKGKPAGGSVKPHGLTVRVPPEMYARWDAAQGTLSEATGVSVSLNKLMLESFVGHVMDAEAAVEELLREKTADDDAGSDGSDDGNPKEQGTGSDGGLNVHADALDDAGSGGAGAAKKDGSQDAFSLAQMKDASGSTDSINVPGGMGSAKPSRKTSPTEDRLRQKMSEDVELRNRMVESARENESDVDVESDDEVIRALFGKHHVSKDAAMELFLSTSQS